MRAKLWIFLVLAIVTVFTIAFNLNVYKIIPSKNVTGRNSIFLSPLNPGNVRSPRNRLKGEEFQIDKIPSQITSSTDGKGFISSASHKSNGADNTHLSHTRGSEQNISSVVLQTPTEEFRISHLMTIHGNGRLGNQMFELASLLGVCALHGYTPYMTVPGVLGATFDINIRPRPGIANSKHFGESRAGVYDKRIETLDHARNWTLGGYFQSWRYFGHAADLVRKTLKINSRIIQKANAILAGLNIRNRTVIGVHIRRGDMNTHRELSRGYNVAPASYILKAVSYYKKNYKNSLFVVVSDDHHWPGTVLRGNEFHIIPKTSAALDLAVLSLANHSIITSGTFGWWGAFLAGGDVVYFKNYPKKGSWLATQYNKSDYYFPHWVGME